MHAAWEQVTNFEHADYPQLPLDSLKRVFEVIGMDIGGMGFEKGINLK